jgi:hypothetical protein
MSRTVVHITMLWAVVCVFGCSKKFDGRTKSSSDPSIAEAAQYFSDNLSVVPAGSKAVSNIRLSTQRSLLWDSAYTIQGISGTLVVVPVKFDKALYMQTAFSGSVLFNLNNTNKLVFYKDSTAQYHCLSVTLFPDSNSLAGKSQGFTGVILSESWDGSISQRYRYNSDGSIALASNPTPAAVANFTMQSMHSGKETDVIISQCSDISGYNYSADDPGDTYAWSESNCNDVYLPDPIARGSFVSSLARTLSGPGRGLPLTVTVAAGTRSITDIAQYFGCFTIESGPATSYSVQVCVDQPDPGTRTPWTFTSSAFGGSSVGNNPVNVGHTFLILTENNGGTIITRNVGFYPTTFVSPTPPKYASTQGMLNDDEDHSYNISLTISNVSSTDFQQILNYVSLGNNPGFSYDINSNNCSTFAISAVGAGGIALPITKGTWPNGSGDDPGDLGEDIANMTLGSNMVRNPADSPPTNPINSPHPNTGNCQ